MPNTPPIQRDAAKVELKPCRHCQREPRLVHVTQGEEQSHWWAVICDAPPSKRFKDPTYCWGVSGPRKLTAEEAAEAWNQRDLRPDDALREAATRFLAAAEGRYFLGVMEELADLRAALNERNPKP